MERPDYLSVANAIFAERFSDAACAFIAGSIVTGHGTPSSDIDIVVVYNDEEHETYRDSLIRDGWPVELFVQNLKSQEYFFNADTKRGVCTIAHMIVTGHVIGPDAEVAQKRKEAAQSIIDQGPEAWDQDKIDKMRYHLTALLDDLYHPKDPDYKEGILSQLFIDLGDFYLRAADKWSGNGKQLVKAFKKNNPALGAEYMSAFAEARLDNLKPLGQLLEKILQPYGGPLFENYKAATEVWKS